MELTEKQAARDPIHHFESWRQHAYEAGELQPDAMALATVGKNGRPSVRFVMLRGVGDQGLVFYTNYESRKGEELAENRWGSLAFYWPKSERQVRAEGLVERVTPEESDAYFEVRPHEAQIEAWASPQSQAISNREWLESRWKNMEAKFPERVPRPESWGGYRLRSILVEFWQQRPHRMHDRLRYQRRDNEAWSLERLSP